MGKGVRSIAQRRVGGDGKGDTRKGNVFNVFIEVLLVIKRDGISFEYNRQTDTNSPFGEAHHFTGANAASTKREEGGALT